MDTQKNVNSTQRTIIVTIAIALSLSVIAYILFSGKQSSVTPDDGAKQSSSFDEQYAKMQDEFAQNFPCGITDFDSPHVKAMDCDPSKMQKGEAIKITVIGTVFDEDEGTIDSVSISVNGGDPVLSDKRGDYSIETEVDSVKKAITIVADKSGYSPVRKVLYAEVPNENRTGVEIPEIFDTQIIMRPAEIVSASVSADKEVMIVSDQTDGLSVTIPAGSLVNAAGQTVTGAITGEITYLDPNDPRDERLVPGFDGNILQMVGINSNGEQVVLGSRGMVFFHFTQAGSEEILQLKKGTNATITQPMSEEDYKTFAEIESTNAADLTEEEMELVRKENAAMTEQERIAKKEREADFGFNYWHFNKSTGLWEAWPISEAIIDVANKRYVLEVASFY